MSKIMTRNFNVAIMYPIFGGVYAFSLAMSGLTAHDSFARDIELMLSTVIIIWTPVAMVAWVATGRRRYELMAARATIFLIVACFPIIVYIKQQDGDARELNHSIFQTLMYMIVGWVIQPSQKAQ